MVKKGKQTVGKHSKRVGKRRQVVLKILPKAQCLRNRAFAYGKSAMPTLVGTLQNDK